MTNLARVIKITEHGDEQMREAIAQGLVSEDMKGAMEKMLRENELLRRENESLLARNTRLEAVNVENRRAHAVGYKALLGERSLVKSVKGVIVVIVALTAMLTITAASIVLWLAQRA